MVLKINKKFEGSTVHVQVRPGYARTVVLDRATEKELKLLHELKHPAVSEEKPPPSKKG